MVHYRRNFIAGGTFFFTVTLNDRASRALVEHVDILRTAVSRTQRSQPFTIDAVAVLPDHLHIIMTLPEGDADYPNRWRVIKRRFTDGVRKSKAQAAWHQNESSLIWQTRYWEHTIRDENDFEQHVNYIHFNPVRHSLVDRACDWPYSSFHRYVRLGLLPQDWAGDFSQDSAGFGERRW